MRLKEEEPFLTHTSTGRCRLFGWGIAVLLLAGSFAAAQDSADDATEQSDAAVVEDVVPRPPVETGAADTAEALEEDLGAAGAEGGAGGVGEAIRFDFAPLPAMPAAGEVLGSLGGDVIFRATVTEADGDGTLYRLVRAGDVWQWEAMDAAPQLATNSGHTTAGGTLYVIGGERGDEAVATVRALSQADGAIGVRELPDLPRPLVRPAASVMAGTLYVAGGGAEAVFYALDLADEAAGWRELQAWDGPPVAAATMVTAIDRLFLFGGHDAGDSAEPATWTWDGVNGWRKGTAAPAWPTGAKAAAVGPSHVFVVGGTDDAGGPNDQILAYHTITDRWFDAGRLETAIGGNVAAVSLGESLALVGDAGGVRVTPRAINPPFPFLDYAVVGVYLLGMIALGWFFVRRSTADDYFRGGRRIPWWATGMSLFATGASAISLMAMPGKSYSSDWQFFIVSIISLLSLPIGLFIIAPLVRRLNIKTANEYLERRFGVVARLFASVIYIFAQLATRFAAIMLLPAIALEAIAGVPTVYGILIMGAITTIYTFLGGLSAVIWTDTIQGFVMIAAVAGCLILALTRLDGGVGAGFGEAYDAGKFTMLDLSPSLMRLTTTAWLINVLVACFGGISDQNFVQRVQATATLGDAQRAVATQMLVAVPINVLLFGLGTALWLFYRSRPEQLSPIMQTDSVFPFFVAQQLPVGLSGLVMAALLAATMSTVSSAICSTSDLGVNDFYRRFNPAATDQSSVVLGRILTAVFGVIGTVAAIGLDQLGSPSVWDLALKLTGLITNGILGLFWLGLLTKRATEVGALVGVACGMLTVGLLQTYTDVTFLVYQGVGAGVAIVVGYAASLLLPFGRRDVTGLTIFTLGRGDEDGDVVRHAS